MIGSGSSKSNGAQTCHQGIRRSKYIKLRALLTSDNDKSSFYTAHGYKPTCETSSVGPSYGSCFLCLYLKSWHERNQ